MPHMQKWFGAAYKAWLKSLIIKGEKIMLKNLLKVVVILTVLVAIFQLVMYFVNQKKSGKLEDDFDDEEFGEGYLPIEGN